MIKYVLVLLILSSCSVSDEYLQNNNILKHTKLNNYEIFKIGPYCCVGMEGSANRGGVWCDKYTSECKL